MDETEELHPLTKARALIAKGELEESLALVKEYWLQNPEDGDAASLMSDLMRDIGRSELSMRLTKLSERLPGRRPAIPLTAPLNAPIAEALLTGTPITGTPITETPIKETPVTGSPITGSPIIERAVNEPPVNQPAAMGEAGPQELFEAGYSLIDARQHELAAMLLNRAAALVPEEPVVNYELGFSLMSLKRFEQAIPYFEQVLSKGEDFDALLNLTICYSLTRQLLKAQAMVSKLEKLRLDKEQAAELTNRKIILRRLASLQNKQAFSARDWLYALYGSILLQEKPAEPRPLTNGDNKLKAIAFTLAILKGVLEGLRLQPEIVEFYGPQSRPLAKALAELLEIPSGIYGGPGRSEYALLTMTWAADIIGPHESFRKNLPQRTMFAYALPWHEPLPVTPEIIGCMGDEEPMPWVEEGDKFKPGAELSILEQDRLQKEVEAMCKTILDGARDLESDPGVIHSVQEALDYYAGKESSLVIGNSRNFPMRTEYTAEVLV